MITQNKEWLKGYGEGKQDIIKEVEDLIKEIFYYETKDGLLPLISIDKLEEFEQRLKEI